MSDAKIDKILIKYENTFQRTKNDTVETERRREARDGNYLALIDSNTPMKENLVGQREEKGSLLRQLDQLEKKYVISEKNYADAGRKCEKMKAMNNKLEADLEKERKCHMQELIDIQNKLHLLQTDNEQLMAKLKSKDHSIAVIEEKLEQKEAQISTFEEELELISKKLFETKELREREEIVYKNHQEDMNNEQSVRALDMYREKYEKQIKLLSSEIDRFNKEVMDKEKEKRSILLEIEEITKKHKEEKRELKEVMRQNEEQYQSWLDEVKREKLELVEKYEEQIRQIRKEEMNTKMNKCESAIEEANKVKIVMRELEGVNIELQNQLRACKSDMETLGRIEKEKGIKLVSLEEEYDHMKSEYMNQVSEDRKILASLESLEEKYEKLKEENNVTVGELISARRKIEEILPENKRIQKEMDNLRQGLGKEQKSLISAKRQLSEATNNEINLNSSLTHTITKLQAKIQGLEKQLESITTELYAERLEKAKVMEELQESRVELRREYELSLENTRRELEEQMKENSAGRNCEDVEKEKMYLEMFKLEREYELLKSEIVTSDEMLKMGSKMNKYYQRKLK